MPTNGWIYAFLGASQYSLYAFEADENYRKEALAARNPSGPLSNFGIGGIP